MTHRTPLGTRASHRSLLPLTAVAVLVAGCGAQVEEGQEASAASTVTVQRCGEEVEYTTPQRVVAYEAGSADKLFALGLTDHVHGYVMPPANPPVEESPWAEEYARVEFLSDDLLNRELVVDAGADLVVAGWNSGFSEERGITPEILDGLGIQSFMHTESCFNYPGHPEEVTPFEGLYTDLERLGRIFGVEDRAGELVTDYRARVAAVEEQAPAGDPVPVFLYDSGTDQPFTAGGQVPPNDIISRAGGENIFAGLDERWTQVGWEAVVEAEPEVIIILDYGDQPAQEKIDFLTSFPAMAEVPAVVEENFFVLDYNEGISGPRNIDGLEKFAEYLRGLEQG
ncbi:ABC transporter substrate-binding protein [Nocardiopsis dassonvillei]|uniref:Periplasmic binding protein n=1 Tax=Nocardiopsis dassonvillei (strain ATCC 23218 / DSM 43111 / CIP 107115 / JCM 7437 / KCTC 9190 / NBRC 14626 / NCTC 10488 / NRRL B-5397 / IMRU 509) TaxID=446468 RepID=D7AW07_NOCDD|nr:ABC transporter substrate-binding protein [Nocardiopsis dassonvillei]ADH69667.1 periplasmic binding protein [Nocardiopsis dassonvillei subsp. dassonvillei DSM 43111]NKY78143.1 ABC transporter substrate-binding protein [Nocardiopsis dassonvillei]VEI90180.1 Hemin-binding periplasmic protein hmuT precursor [Nocardiopsis dassonvillei]